MREQPHTDITDVMLVNGYKTLKAMLLFNYFTVGQVCEHAQVTSDFVNLVIQDFSLAQYFQHYEENDNPLDSEYVLSSQGWNEIFQISENMYNNQILVHSTLNRLVTKGLINVYPANDETIIESLKMTEITLDECFKSDKKSVKEFKLSVAKFYLDSLINHTKGIQVLEPEKPDVQELAKKVNQCIKKFQEYSETLAQ